MDAIYCFCFTPALLPAELRFEDCGWEDPVEVQTLAGLGVVLSRVPLERFAGPEAERRLADIDWLVPRAQAHDRVISRSMERSTVLPLTFGTLFSSLSAAALEVAGRRRALLDFFERMDGREEWAIKVTMDRERAIAARLRVLDPDVEEAPSDGRAYLARQRRRGEAERAIGPWLKRLVAGLDDRLEERCERLLVRPARDEVVASRACLVAHDRAGMLRETIEAVRGELGEQGLAVHCSGPWPLYSFCPSA